MSACFPLVPGQRLDLGRHTFTAEEIVAFAREFDWQPFHVDPEAAKASVLGGLCASGWHTAAVWMRRYREGIADLLAARAAAGEPLFASGPSPGFTDLRWIKPVMAGSTIAFATDIVSVRESASRPGWFVLGVRNHAMDESGAPVLTFDSVALAQYPV